jgi:hypothetical protein
VAISSPSPSGALSFYAPPSQQVRIEFNSLQFVPRAVLLVFFYILIITFRYQLKQKELKLRFKSPTHPGKRVVPLRFARLDSRLCHTAYFRRPSEKRGQDARRQRQAALRQVADMSLRRSAATTDPLFSETFPPSRIGKGAGGMGQ